MATQFHASVTPCEQYGTPHPCYACGMAGNSEGPINDIANALKNRGFNTHIDQTGGMTMVGVCITDFGTFSWNEECLLYSVHDYQEENYYENPQEFVIDADDSADFVGDVLDLITMAYRASNSTPAMLKNVETMGATMRQGHQARMSAELKAELEGMN